MKILLELICNVKFYYKDSKENLWGDLSCDSTRKLDRSQISRRQPTLHGVTPRTNAKVIE